MLCVFFFVFFFFFWGGVGCSILIIDISMRKYWSAMTLIGQLSQEDNFGQVGIFKGKHHYSSS